MPQIPLSENPQEDIPKSAKNQQSKGEDQTQAIQVDYLRILNQPSP
jgi:hypothetical protein